MYAFNFPQRLLIVGMTGLINLVLTVLSVITPYWIIFKSAIPNASGHIGLAPYRSFWPSWLQTSACFMYITFATFLPIIVLYLYTYFMIMKHGIGRRNRLFFTIIHYLFYVITCFQMVAFASSAIGCAQHPKDQSWKLGFSAYFSLASFIISVIPGSFATIIAKQDCR